MPRGGTPTALLRPGAWRAAAARRPQGPPGWCGPPPATRPLSCHLSVSSLCNSDSRSRALGCGLRECPLGPGSVCLTGGGSTPDSPVGSGLRARRCSVNARRPRSHAASAFTLQAEPSGPGAPDTMDASKDNGAAQRLVHTRGRGGGDVTWDRGVLTEARGSGAETPGGRRPLLPAGRAARGTPGAKESRDGPAGWTSSHRAQAACDASNALQDAFNSLSQRPRLSFHLQETVTVMIQ